MRLTPDTRCLNMKVADFDFTLPDDRIALHPAEPRDAARLLQVSRFFFDFNFSQLPDLLHAGDVLVFNDSKVIPARLFGTCAGKSFEVLLHKAQQQKGCWTAFIRNLKKLKEGDVLTFGEGLEATLLAKPESGEAMLSFTLSGTAFFDVLSRIGHMPLPPYIKRDDTTQDAADYQTIYARTEGSVAAPTAGLHFTPALMQRLKDKGIGTAFVTLHVGAGTFQPVKVADTNDHIMHSEYAEISAETAATINAAKAAGKKIVAVGTTALRTLESAARADGTLARFAGETDIFITPGYQFKMVDRLVTNFHLPKSTLFMLVCAFAGMPRMKAAYDHAIASGYRFYSYGDACLLDRMG